MSKLFEPFRINKLEIKNRFVRSATVDNLGKGQVVSQAQLDLYRELARGQIGLIISSGLFPSLDGWAAPGQVGIHRDELVPSLKVLPQAVHQNGGLIIAQLMHAGWFGNRGLSGLPVVGPSALLNPANGLQVRELSSQEVYRHVDDFVQAGRRALEAGFDGVQIHAAHSWLVSAFLSPATNQRQDEWGGSTQKRGNFVLKIIEGIRRVAGPDFPILIKLGLRDYHPQGKSVDEGINSAVSFVEAGLDAIEISEGLEGLPFHHIRLDAVQPYYLEECRRARAGLSKPLILVGGFRHLSDMQGVVDDGIADAVSMCRPFVMDQHLVHKLRLGLVTSSECTSCNGCIQEMHKGNLHCVFREKLITLPSP
jgi:2,4-dienoyl-CoA reductase-like NADH-dependent reductase (Old Yellow Enzyme family)